MAVEAPTTNFIWTDYIFDEKHTITEAKGQFVKKLNVFQKVVIGCSGIRILIVVTIYQKFYNWFSCTRIYEGLKPN